MNGRNRKERWSNVFIFAKKVDWIRRFILTLLTVTSWMCYIRRFQFIQHGRLMIHTFLCDFLGTYLSKQQIHNQYLFSIISFVVSKVADCDKTWKPDFQAVLGIFCITWSEHAYRQHTLSLQCIDSFFFHYDILYLALSMNYNITELVMYCRVRNVRQKEAERIQCIKSDKHLMGIWQSLSSMVA